MIETYYYEYYENQYDEKRLKYMIENQSKLLLNFFQLCLIYMF